jgi:hypothetical protein
LIAFYLSNAPLRANAAKGVTGYDLATLIWGGPGSPGDHPNYYDRADHHDAPTIIAPTTIGPAIP